MGQTMTPAFPFLAILFFLGLLPSPAIRAEEFKLSTGKIYEGLILREEGNHFVISVDGSEIMIFKSTIQSINGVPYEEKAPEAAPPPRPKATAVDTPVAPPPEKSSSPIDSVASVPAPGRNTARASKPRAVNIDFQLGSRGIVDQPVGEEYASFTEVRKWQVLFDVAGGFMIRKRALFKLELQRPVLTVPEQQSALDSVLTPNWNFSRTHWAARLDPFPVLFDWDNPFVLFLFSAEFAWTHEKSSISQGLDRNAYGVLAGRIKSSLDEGRPVPFEDGFSYESDRRDRKFSMCVTPSANTELRLGYFAQEWRRPVWAFEFRDTATAGPGAVACFYTSDLESRGFSATLTNREYVRKGPLLWNVLFEYRMSVFNRVGTSFVIRDTAVEPQYWAGRGVCGIRVPVNDFIFWDWEVEGSVASFKYAHDKAYRHPLNVNHIPLLAGHFKKIVDDYLFSIKTGLTLRL